MPQGLNAPAPQPPTAPQQAQPNPQPQTSPNQGTANIMAGLQGQALHDTQQQQIVINGQETGRYLTGGDLVGNDPTLPPTGYSVQQPGGPEQLPNYNKLTGAEQWIMNALPGIPKGLTDALDGFNNTWAGKALSYLDWPAEQVERFTGFASQAAVAYGDPTKWADFQKNMKSAWYAGSLSADMANLGLDVYKTNEVPKDLVQNEILPGATQPFGLSIVQYHDLPGVEGLVQSRQKINALVAGGMTYDDALAKTKEEYLTSQGALALRAQLQDTAVHLFGDPLNALLPFLKPIEKLHALREGILSAKVVTPAIEAEKAVGLAEEAVRVTEEAVKTAETAGDATKLAEVTTKATEAKTTLAIAQEQKVVAAAAQLNPAERFIIKMTGGIETNPTTLLTPKNIGKLIQAGDYGTLVAEAIKSPFRLFELTPESKAVEYAHMLQENINSRILGGSVLKDGTYDVEKVVRSIMRGSAGMADPSTLGHMVATLEGQHVVGVMKEIADGVGKVGLEFKAAEQWERPLINMIGLTVGEHPASLLAQLDKGEEAALFTRFTEKLGENPNLQESFAKLLERNGYTPQTFNKDVMKMALGVFKGNNYYESGAAIAEIGNLIGDAVAKQTLARYGIEHRGFVQALSDLTKQAESLAFLKLNPAYPVRNFYNNVVTMYARGALGNLTPAAIEDYFKLVGTTPLRISEGRGILSGEEEFLSLQDLARSGNPLSAGEQAARKAIADASKPTPGVLSKMSDGLRSLSDKIPKSLDFSNYSQEIEKWASANAMATFHMRGQAMFGKAGNMWLKVGDFSPALAKQLGPEAARQLEHLTQEAFTNPVILDRLVSSSNIELTTSEIISSVEDKLGRKIDGLFPEDYTATLRQDLGEALRSGNPEQVNAVMEDAGRKLDEHIASLHDGGLETITQQALSQTKTEGPMAFAKIYADERGAFMEGLQRHAVDEAKAAESIRNLENPALRSSSWKRNFAQSQSYFDRQFQRMEANLGGMFQGAEEAGLGLKAQEFKDSLANWKGDWKEFFDFRNKTLQNFFEGEQSGPKWEAITQELDRRYQAMTLKEQGYVQHIDGGVQSLLPPDQRDLFGAWRERVNALQMQDKADLLAFRQKVRTLPLDKQQAEYDLFNASRQKSFQAQWNEERAGVTALQGGESTQLYQEGIAAKQQEAQSALAALQQKVGGAVIAPEQQAAIDNFVRKADPVTAEYIDGLKNELGQLQTAQTTPQEPTQLNQIEKRLAQSKLQETAQTPEQGGLLSRLKKAEQQVEAKPITRNWRAGTNNGSITFASEAQKDLYDAGAASSRSIRDVGSRGVDLQAPKTVDLDALAKKYNITREEASSLASKVYADVRTQAKGIAEGETRVLKDEVSGLSKKIEAVPSTPSWVQNNIDNAWQRYERTGTPAEIEKLASEGLTKKQIAKQLGIPGEDVTALRAKMGIPSQDMTSEYQTWLSDYQAGKRYSPTATVSSQASNIAARDKAVSGIMSDRLDAKSLKDYGWPYNKAEVLNSVNADRADAGLTRAKSLKEVPIAESISAIDKRIGTTADLAKKAVLAPRSALPPQLSQDIEQTAKQLADELSSGSVPAKYVSETGTADSTANVLKSTPSSMPDWFQEISKRYHYGRNDVNEAIQKIITDAGSDKGKAVEAVKQAILDAMSSTNPLTGEPPTPEILRMLGKPEEEIRAAEEGWKALGAQPPTVDVPQTGNQAADLQAEITQTEQMVIEKALGEAPKAGPQDTGKQFLPDFETVKKPEMMNGTGLDQLNFNHGQNVMAMMREEALKAMEKPRTKWADVLGQDGEQTLQRYLEHVKSGYSDARYATTRFAEYGRDSALLNYNRRFNYNTALGTVMPYEFWATQSIYKWALHSIDRPAMFTTYLRMKKLLETAYRPEQGMPSRFKDMIRVQLPFLPEWMGKDQFIDPLSIALPFDKFASPYEEYQKQQVSDVGAARSKLQEMYNDQKITKAEFQQAQDSRSGPQWDRAVTLARMDDSQDRLNGWDFAKLFTSPHAPIQWAIDAARGKETGNVLPITNDIAAVQGAFGIDPAGGLNLEASIRKQLGFHPFNQWDDYYVDRELSNMAGDGTISSEEARRAMIDRKGPAFDIASKRVGMENSGGPAGAFMGLLGIPVHSYPVGEEHQRQLQDEYTAAGHAYEQTGDYKSTLGKFNDAHPEYEARLALYKKPEERLSQFLVDNIYSKFYDLPKLDQRLIADQLGKQFTDNFMTKGAKPATNLPPDLMATWLKLMGGDPPGSLTPKAGVAPLTLPSQDVAYRAQTFYNGRDNFFPNWKAMQDAYYKIPDTEIRLAPDSVYTYLAMPKGSNERKQYNRAHPEIGAYFDSGKPLSTSPRQQYIQAHPQYQQYLNWRKDFMLRNPEVTPYLTDLSKYKPKGYDQALAQSNNQPNFTADEWKQTTGWTLYNLIQDVGRGYPLDDPTSMKKLQQIADQYGWHGSLEEFEQHILEAQ